MSDATPAADTRGVQIERSASVREDDRTAVTHRIYNERDHPVAVLISDALPGAVPTAAIGIRKRERDHWLIDADRGVCFSTYVAIGGTETATYLVEGGVERIAQLNSTPTTTAVRSVDLETFAERRDAVPEWSAAEIAEQRAGDDEPNLVTDGGRDRDVRAATPVDSTADATSTRPPAAVTREVAERASALVAAELDGADDDDAATDRTDEPERSHDDAAP